MNDINFYIDNFNDFLIYTIPFDKNFIEDLKTNLVFSNKFRTNRESNFILSHNNIMACFLKKIMVLTDVHFNPILIYKSSSYICGCTISDKSKYTLVITANNPNNDQDSGAAIIIDIKKRLVINRIKNIEIKGITHLYIDENKEDFYIYYNQEKIKYNFKGKSNNSLYNKANTNIAEQLLEKARQKLKQEATTDVMNDEDFEQFVAEQKERFSTDTYKNEFERVARKQKSDYSDEYISLREHLLLTVNSMLKAEEYYSDH